MNPRDYEEKRLYRRIALKMPVRYALNSAPEEFRQAMGSDLSAGGMALFCEEALGPGVQIKLIIDSDSPNYPALETEAEVHRVVATETGDYEISVIFRKVT